MAGGVARFWREIPQRYNIIGNKCGSCERVFFPPREACPHCRRKSLGKMEDIKLSGKGEIVTYTIIHVGPEIVDCNIDEVKIGMKVENTFRRIQEDGYTGAIYYGYKFKKRRED
jgi:uncharacterized OB-fold protein